MRRAFFDWLSSRSRNRTWSLPFHWGGGELILAAILIFGILSLGSGMVGKWINATEDSGLLPVTIHSLGEADYSVDEVIRTVPVISLDIIRDLMGIFEPPETGGEPDTALIAPNTPSPTSTFPSSDFPDGTATEPIEKPESATATKPPRATATSNQIKTATPTLTSLPPDAPTLLPTETNSPPKLTAVPKPSLTQTKNATSTKLPTQSPPTATAPIPASSTPVPSPLPPPTNTQAPSPLPVNSPTPKPTRSLEVTPTAQYPGVTGEPPP